MSPSHTKRIRTEAKKSASEFKKIIKKMDSYMNGSSNRSVELASAFYQILLYHLEKGDLTAQNVKLAAYLREKINVD